MLPLFSRYQKRKAERPVSPQKWPSEDVNAQFKGEGTINGSLDHNGQPYKFMLWAKDGSPDTFRIKIWWESGGQKFLVYDNGSGQAIGGGSIVVHTN